MSHKIFITVLSVLLLSFLVSPPTSQAAIKTIHYQGRLRVINGALVNGVTKYFKASYYDAQVGGSLIWADGTCYSSVVSFGVFEINLNPTVGSLNYFNSNNYWMTLQMYSNNTCVTLEDTFPREQILSSPLSVTSSYLSGISGYDTNILGNARVGLVTDTIGGAGYGSLLYLSGGNALGGGWNSDNSDPLWLGRYNAASDQSELRVIVGDNDGSASDKFVVGASSGGTWFPKLTVQMDGNVGVNTGSPSYPLDVAGAIRTTESASRLIYLGETIISDTWGADTTSDFVIHNSNWDGSSNNNYGEITGGHFYSYGGIDIGSGNGHLAGGGQLYVQGTTMLMSNVGIGTTVPASKLDIDTGSNTLGLRLRGTAETTEIGDIYVQASGSLILSTANTGATQSYIEVDGEDDQYGLIIRDSNTGSSVYSNLYMNDAGIDYLNIVSGNTNATAGLVVQTGGNVGIGTTSPGDKLHVADLVSTVGNPTIRLEGNTGGWGAGVEAGAALTGGSYLAMGKAIWDGESSWNTTASTQDSYFTIHTALNGALGERLRITSGGNVGIGTASPGYKLNVTGPGSTYIARFDSPDGYLQLGPANSGWAHLATDRPRFWFSTGITVDTGAIGSYDEDFLLQVAGVTADSILASDLSTRIGVVTNDDGGIVGNGNLLRFSGGDDWASFDSDNSDSLWIARYNAANDQSQLRVNIGDRIADANDKFIVGTDDSTQGGWNSHLIVQANGYVGIGTVSPLAKLGVVGGVMYTADTNTRFGAQISGDDGGRSIFGSNLYVASDYSLKTFGTHGSYGYSGMEASWGSLNFYTASGATTQDTTVTPTSRMTITTAGKVGIGTTNPSTELRVEGVTYSTSYQCGSDLNLKKDIEVLDGQTVLEKLKQINGVNFKWKDGDDQMHLGVIAQDVEKVFPEAVSTDESTNLKSVNYDSLVAPLVEAVKEQQKQIEDLQKEIEDLKQK